MTLYRIYIDEVGNEGMNRNNINHPNDRYLSLTGVIIESQYYTNEFHPHLFSFKTKYIPGYPDDPLGKSFCLHRKDILKRQSGFEFLNDTSTREVFDEELIETVQSTEFTVVSVVIDKLAHLDLYGTFHKQPYFYCLEVMIERFVMFLEDHNGRGDVMIEARGKNKDKSLKNIFEELYNIGTRHISKTRLQKALTSKTIKIKPKEKNVYGLQLADIVAPPSYIGIKRQKIKQEPPGNFGGQIFQILLEHKYNRVATRIWGIGMKWLP